VNVPLTYAIGDTTIWGGYHWENLTGALGSKVDDLNLDSTNWSKIAFNSTDYNISYDEITYDYENDFISGRKDALGNNMTFTFEDFSSYEKHAIKFFMWGNSRVQGNTSFGFENILNFRGVLFYTYFEKSFVLDDSFFGTSFSFGSVKFESASLIEFSNFGKNSVIEKSTFQSGSVIQNCTFGSSSSIETCVFQKASNIQSIIIPSNQKNHKHHV